MKVVRRKNSRGASGGQDPSTDAEELERPLTPPDTTPISLELLDELFEAEDPRVQSGIAADESDDDLDFVRMSGLTRLQTPADSHYIEQLTSALSADQIAEEK